MEGIILHPLGLGTLADQCAVLEDLHPHFAGISHPDFVFHDFGLQSSLAEFRGDIICGFLVFRRAGNVRLGGQSAQMLLCQFWIRYGEKPLLDLLLLS